MNLEKKAHLGDLEEVNMLKSMQQSKRQEAIKNLHENKTFMKEWFEEGRKDWAKNQKIRAHEIKR